MWKLLQKRSHKKIDFLSRKYVFGIRPNFKLREHVVGFSDKKWHKMYSFFMKIRDVV